MASPEVEKYADQIRKTAGPEAAAKYVELSEKIHACAKAQDFAGMRAVVLEAKQLLIEVEEKRNKK